MARLVSNEDNNEWTINLDLVQIMKLDDRQIRFYFKTYEDRPATWCFTSQSEAECVYRNLQRISLNKV